VALPPLPTPPYPTPRRTYSHFCAAAAATTDSVTSVLALGGCYNDGSFDFDSTASYRNYAYLFIYLLLLLLLLLESCVYISRSRQVVVVNA